MNSDPSPSAGGGSSHAVSSNNAAVNNDCAPIIMSKFRYGREEMLLLFNRCNLPPDPLKTMQGLYVEKKQMPINLITLTEEENCMWNRGINSDLAVRMVKAGPGSGVGVPAMRGALGGRGGSVDRGRVRSRGSYHYSRGLSYDDPDTGNGFNSRRSYERLQSQGSWAERNGGESTEYTATSPRKEFGSRNVSDTNWRRHRGGSEDEDTWRNSRSEKWSRSSTNSWRGSDNSWDRSNNNYNNHLPQRKHFEGDETNLPEWAVENPSESGGRFDASGAFHGGSTYSDDDENEEHRGPETTKNNNSGTSQPRPASNGNKEPPNIPNGNISDSSNSSLKQSQSSSNLCSVRRPVNHHPITTSASFSGVDNILSSQSSQSSKPFQKEEVHKVAATVTHQPQTPVQLLTQVSPPVVEPKAVPKTNDEVEVDLAVFVSQLTDEEEKDPPTTSSSLPTSSTTATVPPHTQKHPHSLNDSLWYYQDPQGNVQGPFQSQEMAEWFSSGYFKGTLLVRRACDERYSPLSELIKLWGDIPFMRDYYQVPPIKNNEPVVQRIDENLLMQVQYQQQHQRLMMQRALAKIGQPDQYNNLTAEQQQLLAHQAPMEMSLQAGLMNQHVRTQNQQPQQPQTSATVFAMLQQLAHYHKNSQVQTVPQVAMPVPSPAEPPSDPVEFRQLMQQISLQQASATRPIASPSDPDQRSIELFMNAFRQRQVNPHTV